MIPIFATLLLVITPHPATQSGFGRPSQPFAYQCSPRCEWACRPHLPIIGRSDACRKCLLTCELPHRVMRVR
jgi:hypothetical protein